MHAHTHIWIKVPKLLLSENAFGSAVGFIHAEKYIPVSPYRSLHSIALFLFRHQTKDVENANI